VIVFLCYRASIEIGGAVIAKGLIIFFDLSWGIQCRRCARWKNRQYCQIRAR